MADDFDSTLHDSINEDIFRVGSNLSLAPGHTVIASALYTDREDHSDQQSDPATQVDFDRRSNISQFEAQYIGAFGLWRVVGGADRAVADARDRQVVGTGALSNNKFRATATNLYLYLGRTVARTLDITASLGYADVDTQGTGTAGITPALGIIWQPISPLRLRAAVGRSMKRPYVANQGLQPTQIAGFNQRLTIWMAHVQI